MPISKYYFTAESTVLIFILLFASVISFYMSNYSFQRRNVSGAVELSFFLFSVALYSFGSILEIVTESMSQTFIMVKFQYFWAILTAPTFFLIILRRIRRDRLPLFIYIITYLPASISFVLGYLTDNFDLIYSRYWIEQGPYYPIFIYEKGIAGAIGLKYLILISFIAEVILLIAVMRTRGSIRMQNLLLLIGGTIPTLNAAFFSDRLGIGFSTQPFALLLLGIFIFTALFYTKMLDFVKLSRDNAVDSFTDYLLILDKNKTILDINKSGIDSELLGDFEIGRSLTQRTEFGKNLINNIDLFDRTGEALSFDYDNSNRHFEISISRTYLTSNRTSGYSIIIHEITETKELMNKLELQALTDPLTGVHNRTYWMVLAEEELKKSSHTGSPFVIMMLDIDHFKSVNDIYGHLFGDFILKEFCKVVTDSIRSEDSFARYGGEEFCVFCSDTDFDIGRTIAERICKNVEEYPFASDGIKKNITVSIGLYHNARGDAALLDKYLDESDKALYRAKTSGRNKVCYEG